MINKKYDQWPIKLLYEKPHIVMSYKYSEYNQAQKTNFKDKPKTTNAKAKNRAKSDKIIESQKAILKLFLTHRATSIHMAKATKFP